MTSPAIVSAAGTPAQADRREERGRRHHQPHHLPRRHHHGHDYDAIIAAWPPRAPTSRRPSSRSPPPTWPTPATCSPRSPPPPTALTAVCPSRLTRASPGTPPAPSPRPSTCTRRWTRTTSSSRSRQPLEGLEAITATLAEGISVNVTLIFSPGTLPRCHQRLPGRPGAGQGKRPRPRPRSTRWPRSSSPAWTPRSTSASTRSAPTKPPRSRARPACANARLAYQVYEELFSTERWEVLADAGARPQRPLWASTGVKDPDYPDTLYVTGLVFPTSSTPCRRRRWKRSSTTAPSRATQ